MPAPRLHVDTPLSAGLDLPLPDNAARHVQVLRLQPGDELSLFDGQGGEWAAQVLQMGRREVTVTVLAHRAINCELQRPVTLALGMPANERMDSMVEKATELGAATIQPLVCERSVLRLAGDRAERKAAHWQAVAIAACEQSGRNRVPRVASPVALRDWLDAQAQPLLRQLSASSQAPLVFLSGPEGGLSRAEQALAGQHGFQPVTLGPRTLRADTAPLAALACIAALEGR